jgi:hypothetical protein
MTNLTKCEINSKIRNGQDCFLNKNKIAGARIKDNIIEGCIIENNTRNWIPINEDDILEFD